MGLTKAEKRRICMGCRDNFYNGNNPLGITECWSFKTAKVVMRKRVHISQVPPWKQKAIRTLSCYHEPQYVMVGEHQER